MSQAHESHDDHAHGHGHGSRFIQHHYDDAQHQFEAGKLGIWLFLAQEVLFFSALFVAYILYRFHHPEIYSYAHTYLDVKMGAINTAVLIFSSATAAWAVRCAQLNQRKGLIACIVLTILCACTFMVVKYLEYSHKVHEHILFGRFFDPCVSSGGTPLLTKNNECPGHKSTVQWDFGTKKAAAGCLEAATLDQDPRTEGVQASCRVKAMTMASRPKQGGGEEWVETKSTPITKQCADPIATAGHHEGGHDAVDHTASPEGSVHPKNFPCWRPAAQPAVCPDLTTADQAISGSAKRPQVGIIVEYGDHEHRGHDLRIGAECDAPPKPAAVADAFADKANTIVVGAKTLQTDGGKHQPLTKHELHAREAAGPPPEHTNMFFTIYFAMTGLHGVHVLFGIGVFIWLLIRATKGHFTPDYFGPVDFAALYWHIVDLIWIFLFPLLYLIH